MKNKNLLLGDDLKVLILRQRWKPLTLLSIIVPVSLLVSFRLTGILSGPEGSVTIAETMTLETVKWESERPYGMIGINDEAQSVYNGDVEIIQNILIDRYDPTNLETAWIFGGGYCSSISLTANITASVPVGFVKNVRLSFYEHYEDARIGIWIENPLFHTKNLSIVESTSKLTGKEAFVDLIGVNTPSSTDFWVPVRWMLRSPNNQTHQLDAISEVVYFNGTVYKKVVQPFQLKIVPDDNDSFETAEEIREGYYPKLFLGPPDGDIKDYYKINLSQGQRIEVYVNGTSWSWPISTNPAPDFSLYLYDPERNLVVAKESRSYFEIIDDVANSAGFWFIEVRIFENLGFYSLTISLGDNQ